MTADGHVDDSNSDQLRAWDGDQGAFWATHADYFDRSVAAYHDRLMRVAAIGDAERVLDIGCGTGQTTRDAARATTEGSALGVDLSSAMLEHARRRAADEGVTNARFEHLDAQVHPFETGAFDIVVSRSGTMFFGDLDVAFANIARAVRPGGRLALTTWKPLAENEWIRELPGALSAGRDLPAPPADAQGPFSLSDPNRVRGVLEGAGFTDVTLEGVTAGSWFGTDTDDATRFVLGMLGWMLDGLDEGAQADARDTLRASNAAHETPDGVIYGSAAWLITASRR